MTSWTLRTSDGERERLRRPVSLAEAKEIAEALREVGVEARFERKELADEGADVDWGDVPTVLMDGRLAGRK